MLVSVVVCLLQGYGVAEIGGVALGVWIQNGGRTNCLFVCLLLLMIFSYGEAWQEELVVIFNEEERDGGYKKGHLVETRCLVFL
jgi:hypothetical protein